MNTFASRRIPSDLDRPEREISSTEREIDELVYELYGKTPDGRKISES